MRLYRLLLHLYPASFRAEYGDEMCGILARQRRDTGGLFGVAALWWTTLAGTFWNAAAAHSDILRQDLRVARRSLAASRAFAFTAVLVAALGVGATTAVFSVLDHVLIRPLPFADADRLVKLWQRQPGYSRMQLSPANYRDWKAGSHSFEQMAAFVSISNNLVTNGDPERIEGEHASAELFPMLGAQPLLGRLFTAKEDSAESPRVLVLSYSLWQSAF